MAEPCSVLVRSRRSEFLASAVARRALCDTRAGARVNTPDPPEYREYGRFCLRAAFAQRTIRVQARSTDSANIPCSLALLGMQRPICRLSHGAARCSRWTPRISELPTPPAYLEQVADRMSIG